mmetsp:Transcript_6854/g.41797  ORF Transcript_6854/g.41797 Transcript_6854/m.41797 type:complete len:253 (-) Transcript_6854:2210-2968(-)
MIGTITSAKTNTRLQSRHTRSTKKNSSCRRCVNVSAKVKSAREDEQDGTWSAAPKLLLAGAVIGPLLDCIHTSVGLLEYDLATVHVGPLKSSAAVPILLAVYYVVLGLVHLQLPLLLKKLDASHVKPSNATTVIGSLLILALMLEISSILFDNNVGLLETYIVLCSLCVANWYTFDRRPWTLGLGFLVALLAPVSEVVLMKLFNLWHYPQGDISIAGETFPSWVFFCYFFYTPFVTLLSSYCAGQQTRKVVE